MCSPANNILQHPTAYNMTQTDYTLTLNALIDTNGFHSVSMANEAFRELGAKLTDEDMQLAHDMGTKFLSMYSDQLSLGNPDQMTCRPAKRLARVQQKLANTRPGAAFKANSDLIAFRVNVESINYIIDVVEQLRIITYENKGYLFERNSIVNPETGALTDIVTYYFVYIPDYKYIMEFQIGHPFAAYVFARDSELRDNPGCGKVDFWTNDFYSHVRTAILAGKSISDEPLRTAFLTLWDQHGLPREQIDDKLITWFCL